MYETYGYVAELCDTRSTGNSPVEFIIDLSAHTHTATIEILHHAITRLIIGTLDIHSSKNVTLIIVS